MTGSSTSANECVHTDRDTGQRRAPIERPVLAHLMLDVTTFARPAHKPDPVAMRKARAAARAWIGA